MVTFPFWKIFVFVCIQTWYSEHSYLPHCSNTNGLIQSGQSISGNLFCQVIFTCKEAHYSNSLPEWVLNDLASSDMNSKLHMCLLPNMTADTYNLSTCLSCFLFWFFYIRGWHELELEIKIIIRNFFFLFPRSGWRVCITPVIYPTWPPCAYQCHPYLWLFALLPQGHLISKCGCAISASLIDFS